MAGERIKLNVDPRPERGSAEARRLRAKGFVPGVLYSDGKAASAFAVAERELRRVLGGDHGLHTIVDVAVGDGDKARHAVLKDYQVDPVRGRLLHIDLHEVRLDQAIQAQVVIELLGTPEGVTMGGVLSQVNREVTVEALPMEVPDRLELDVSAMAIGDSLRVGDLSAPEGVAILDDPDDVLATVTQPTRVEEPEEVVEEEEELPEGEVPPEERPEGAADQPAEPDADAGGSPGTTPG
jgi:large subunit ribosomal protein L25